MLSRFARLVQPSSRCASALAAAGSARAAAPAAACGAQQRSNTNTARPLLMIPGPIEYSERVLQANAMYGVAHVDPHFIDAFGATLENLREVFLAPDGQPVVMAGSGSLGWDMMVTNLMEEGDEALIVNIGYFGDSMVKCVEAYGFKADQIGCEVGDVPSLEALKSALQKKRYKMVHITHVDTSTAVRSDVEAMTRVVREQQEDALVIVDGVCALAGEELRMSDWDVDGYITGSQKALGVPCGLSIQMLRPRALQAFNKRSSAVPSYYLSYANWLPIMDNYESRKASYFATPAVNLIYALQAGTEEVLENGGMERRFEEHAKSSRAFKEAMGAIGLGQLAKRPEIAANTLSAVLYPKGVDATFLPKVRQHGAIIGGGLHKDCKDTYFRVGHMALSSRTPAHIIQTVQAIESGLTDAGYEFESGAGVKKATEVLQ